MIQRADGAKRLLKWVAERGFGVHLSRTPPQLPSKHADQAIRELRRWSPRDIVFDVGANDGRTILRISGQLSHPQILAFEPVSSTYAVLLERTAALANVRTLRLALGATSGRQEIYLNDVDAMNSLSSGWTAAPTGTELVEVKTVDEVMAEQQIEFIHLLKIDTEGYDLEVLKGATRALETSRIAIIQVEVGVDQLPKALPSLEGARCYLAEKGYRLHGVYNQCRTRARPPDAWTEDEVSRCNFEVLAYCDALFVRTNP